MRKIKIANDAYDNFFEFPEKFPSKEKKMESLKQIDSRAQREKKIKEWLTPMFFEITDWHPEEVMGATVNDMLKEIKDYLDKG